MTAAFLNGRDALVDPAGSHAAKDLLKACDKSVPILSAPPLGNDLHKARNAEKQALFDALRAAGMTDDGNFGKKGAK